MIRITKKLHFNGFWRFKIWQFSYSLQQFKFQKIVKFYFNFSFKIFTFCHEFNDFFRHCKLERLVLSYIDIYNNLRHFSLNIFHTFKEMKFLPIFIKEVSHFLLSHSFYLLLGLNMSILTHISLHSVYEHMRNLSYLVYDPTLTNLYWLSLIKLITSLILSQT